MQTKQNEIPANEQGFFNLMSLAITALVALPVGIACLVLGFGLGDNPCVMCWAERITMIAISLIALFIIRYGLKPGYLAALLLMACWGIFNGFIHYSLDGTFGGYLDIKQGFGLEILGAHTQFWVMVVDFCVIIFLALILWRLSKLLATWQICKFSLYRDHPCKLRSSLYSFWSTTISRI